MQPLALVNAHLRTWGLREGLSNATPSAGECPPIEEANGLTLVLRLNDRYL
jgi:hypothetical protein